MKKILLAILILNFQAVYAQQEEAIPLPAPKIVSGVSVFQYLGLLSNLTDYASTGSQNISPTAPTNITIDAPLFKSGTFKISQEKERNSHTITLKIKDAKMKLFEGDDHLALPDATLIYEVGCVGKKMKILKETPYQGKIQAFIAGNTTEHVITGEENQEIDYLDQSEHRYFIELNKISTDNQSYFSFSPANILHYYTWRISVRRNNLPSIMFQVQCD